MENGIVMKTDEGSPQGGNLSPLLANIYLDKFDKEFEGRGVKVIRYADANLKYKYGNGHFWARGYFVDTVGKNKKQIQEYIQNQLTSDQIADQISIKEFVDPFTGRVNQKA